MSRRTADGAGPRVLIIVQNLPVPFDRRVWLECQALTESGYQVTVVCPRGTNDAHEELLDGVQIYRYRPYAPGGRAIGFVAEYAYSFLATLRLVWRARRRDGSFDVVQACNPPDIFWPLAWGLKSLDRSRFVFDHHDLCPELFDSRFEDGGAWPRWGLVALERETFRAADHVISTNTSYAEVAKVRGRKRDNEVTVVRTGPDPDKLQRAASVPALLDGHQHLVAYIGVMGPQDGVDIAVRAAAHVVHDLGRPDVRFIFMGSGDMYEELVSLREELGLANHLDLPGRVPDSMVVDVLSTAAVGLSPDPKNALNDVSTMNKTMEYMAFGVPVLAFALKETRVSAGSAARYVPDGDIPGYAQALVDLLDDPDQRQIMSWTGRARIEDELGWPHQRSAYVGVYDTLVGRPAALSTRVIQLPADDSQVRRVIELPKDDGQPADPAQSAGGA